MKLKPDWEKYSETRTLGHASGVTAYRRTYAPIGAYVHIYAFSVFLEYLWFFSKTGCNCQHLNLTAFIFKPDTENKQEQTADNSNLIAVKFKPDTKKKQKQIADNSKPNCCQNKARHLKKTRTNCWQLKSTCCQIRARQKKNKNKLQTIPT